MCEYVLDFANLNKQINIKCLHHFGCVFNSVVNAIYSILILNTVSRILCKFVCESFIVANFNFRLQIFRMFTILNALNTIEHDTANKARQSNKKDVKIFRKFMLHKFHIG